MAGAGHIELPAAEMANLEEIAKVRQTPADAASANTACRSIVGGGVQQGRHIQLGHICSRDDTYS
jgi:ribosomal protein L11